MENNSNNKLDPEGFKPEENLNNNSYGDKNYASNAQPPQDNNYPYNIPSQNSGQYIPYQQQQQANFGMYANYNKKNSAKSLSNENSVLNVIELKRMYSVDLGSIYVFAFWLLFLIILVALAIAIPILNTNPLLQQPSTPSYFGPTGPKASSLLSYQLTSLNIAMTSTEVAFGLFWGVGILICGIIGSIRAWELSKKSRFFTIIMIIYIIGIFIPVFEVIAACISISKIKEYLVTY